MNSIVASSYHPKSHQSHIKNDELMYRIYILMINFWMKILYNKLHIKLIHTEAYIIIT